MSKSCKKKQPRANRSLLVIGFVAGIALVISCGEMGTSVLPANLPGAIAAAVADAVEIVFNPEDTLFSSANLQALGKEISDFIEDLQNDIAANKNSINALNNPPDPTCPSSMAQVDDAFCVDQEQFPASAYADAIQGCVDADKRLCEAYELYRACYLGEISGFDNNTWEWTKDVLHNSSANVALFDSRCDFTSYSAIAAETTKREFRCCSDLG